MSAAIQTELTDAEKALVLDFFKDGASPDLSTIVQSVFNDPKLDGKTKQARLIKQFCKDSNLSFKTATVVLKGLLPLTDDQIRYVENNFRVKTPLEITRELYLNDTLTNFSQEFRTISAKIDEVKVKLQKSSTTKDDFQIVNLSYNPSELVKDEYKAPKTLKQTIERINKYLNYGYVEEELKKQQRAETEKLKVYLNTFRFLYQINTFKMQGDRDLFEDAFIRYTHDKPDLTQEDLDQFITLCNHIVRAAEIQRRIEDLRATTAADGNNISMKINEAINILQTELNACETIKTRLYNDLTTKRNLRLEEKNDGVEKLTNLVQAWRDEEFRERTIHLAKLEKERVREEAGRINSLSEIKALLRGATIDELVN